LISLNPDLILIGSIVGKNQIEKIEKLEIPVIALKEENQIEGIFRSLTQRSAIFSIVLH
jgi:ABC-type Fe3+-hydroxamate transport system substrate-binding protein